LNIIQSIVLGIIQGVTEFFPISSSGHLVIIPYFFNWDYPPLYFTVTVHFATLAAVVTIFRREIYRIIRAVILGIFKRSERATSSFKLGIFLIAASIPAAAAGYFLNEYVDNLFSSPLAAAAFLLVTALFLWLGERRGSRIEGGTVNNRERRDRRDGPGRRDRWERLNRWDNRDHRFLHRMRKEVMDSGSGSELIRETEVEDSSIKKIRFNFFIALMAGIGQAIAILPGISRSGSTISFARFFGIKRSEAVRFSFLLSIPVIFGSFVFEIYRSSEIIFNGSLQIVGNLLVGFFFAFITGMLAIKFLVYLVKRKNLNIFAVYCVALSAVTFVFYIIKRFI